MKSKITYGVMLIIIALTPACRKNKTEATLTPTIQEPTVYPDYSQLKVGNYWIYGRYQIDQQNNVANLNNTDSCYIDKDTSIRGNTYYKYHEYDFVYSRHEISYLRDSLHYIIDSDGIILFSSQDFSTVFYTNYITGSGSTSPEEIDTIYVITRKMNDKDLVITVPAGTFTTSNMQKTYMASSNFTISGVNNPRYMNTRYTKDLGLISKTEQFFSNSPNNTERRLLRYHLK